MKRKFHCISRVEQSQAIFVAYSSWVIQCKIESCNHYHWRNPCSYNFHLSFYFLRLFFITTKIQVHTLFCLVTSRFHLFYLHKPTCLFFHHTQQYLNKLNQFCIPLLWRLFWFLHSIAVKSCTLQVIKLSSLGLHIRACFE